ncbi:MAG TPA: TPM domain-containing protein [Thermoanaerobaculia bacterium]|nr:TPM domain-containing protein [Thermoanaerobaculia bacterium]
MRRAAGRAGRGIAAFLVLSACAPVLRADRYDEQIPAKPARYVTDRAGVLGSGEPERLNEKLAQYERDTSNQILVWIDKRVPEGFTLEDFTVRAAQKWGAGQKKTDNGAILFVFTEDRKVRIEVGYGLEGAIPDAIARRIIDDAIVPRFRQGDFAGGVTAGAEALMAAGKGEYKGTGRTNADRGGGGGQMASCLPWLIIFGIFVVIPWFIRRSRAFRTHTGSGWWSGGGGFPMIFGGGGGGGWSGGGGGFSGGGGGFGGGGASGSW